MAPNFFQGCGYLNARGVNVETIFGQREDSRRSGRNLLIAMMLGEEGEIEKRLSCGPIEW
jgi:hypothetical protein